MKSGKEAIMYMYCWCHTLPLDNQLSSLTFCSCENSSVASSSHVSIQTENIKWGKVYLETQWTRTALAKLEEHFSFYLQGTILSSIFAKQNILTEPSFVLTEWLSSNREIVHCFTRMHHRHEKIKIDQGTNLRFWFHNYRAFSLDYHFGKNTDTILETLLIFTINTQISLWKPGQK